MRALDAWLEEGEAAGVLIRNGEGPQIKGSGPNEDKNGISLTKVENVESREICEEKNGFNF